VPCSPSQNHTHSHSGGTAGSALASPAEARATAAERQALAAALHRKEAAPVAVSLASHSAAPIVRPAAVAAARMGAVPGRSIASCTESMALAPQG
ncbi:MAG TPA: hypothetical protein VJV23_16235, partial [Candidatus Polarisedimenticolia bacterium]|nr:hypothetical protein [Candidatus Polarisedimenticolia bacterium]